MLGAGLTVGQTARRLGITPRAVSYHARKLGIPPSKKYAPRADWDDIQAYYDAGHSVRQCQIRFGFSKRSWNKAVERGDVVPRPQALPLGELLVYGRKNQSHAPEATPSLRRAKGEPMRAVRSAGLARGAAHHGAPSCQREWPRQSTREHQAAVPQLPQPNTHRTGSRRVGGTGSGGLRKLLPLLLGLQPVDGRQQRCGELLTRIPERGRRAARRARRC